MSSDDDARDKAVVHPGPAHSAPYPVSRLAPGFSLVDLAAEIEQADQGTERRVGAQLQVIADQVRALQAQAREILAQAHEDHRLNRARCAFRRIPGHIYHLYREADGGIAFSMLSPADWNGKPPKPFLGSYRLENDMSWTPSDRKTSGDDTDQLVRGLLAETERR